MSKRLLTLGLCVLAVPITLLVGCGKEVRAKAAFHAVAVTAGPGPIGRNEDLVIRFSRPLASGVLPARAITVQDARGRMIPVTLERDGRHLVVRPPRSPLEGDVPLWPRTDHLEIQIPVPLAGPTFRSIDGDELAGGYAAKVRVHDGWRRQPGNLEILDSVPEDGATNVPMDASISLTFNAPVHADSLVSGIQMIDKERKVVVDVVPVIDKKDPRRVIIHPFATIDRRDKGRSLLHAGSRYQVVVTRSLRSRDGRRPIERSAITFTNETKGPRYLRVSFTEQSDFADESREAFDPMRLSLRPALRRDFVTSRGDGTSELVSFAAETKAALALGDDPTRIPHVFSRCPSRTQILVDGRWMGMAPRFVTGLVFRLKDELKEPVYANGLMVSLGYLNPNRTDAATGLSRDLDLNVIDGQAMDIGAEDDRVTLSPVPGQPGIVRIQFAKPFLYAGNERDLVIDIRNGGVDLPYDYSAWGGLDVVGAQHQKAGSGRRTIALEGPNGRRIDSDFVLRYMLEVADNRPIVTRWYRITDVERPRFSVPDAWGTADSLDYTLQYQAGAPIIDNGEVRTRPDGTPECTPIGTWQAHPPRGCKALRVRIRFSDRWYPSGEQPPEIEYILVRYKGS